MIIASERVARNVGTLGVVEQCIGVRLVFWQVVHPDGYHAYRSRHEFGGTASFRAVSLHVVHLAMASVIGPFTQPILGNPQVDVTDTDLLETELRAPPDNMILESGQVAVIQGR